MSGQQFWNESAARLTSTLGTTDGGLAGIEAARRLAENGPNDAMARRRRPLALEIADRFANPLILILLFASGLSAWTGEVASFAIIVVIIALSVVLDLTQQLRAENAVNALRRSVALRASVLRDGCEQQVPVEQLVVGDVLHLSAGDVVPADCRLLASRDLFVNQAILTGEAFPVEKHAAELVETVVEVAGATNAVFMGTSVISGTGTALVCRTGRETELGGLAGTLAAQRPQDAFEQGIRRFGMLMLRLTVFLVLFVLAVNVLFHRPWLESLLFALALAVGLTPELLPMVVTVTLANGAKRLADRRVIVKRLAAIHDLGAMDVLCTDKTGTLTESRITLVGHRDTAGHDCEHVLRLATLNSAFESGIKSPLDDAILAHGKVDLSGWTKIDEVPFDFERRRVSVLVDDGRARLLVVKGAPEDILKLSTHVSEISLPPCGEGAGVGGNTTSALPLSPPPSLPHKGGGAQVGPAAPLRDLDDATRRRLLSEFEKLGEEGYRVLGVASREVPRDHVSAAIGDETELTFAGFAVFLDPPKADAAAAISALAKAGVAVKILTGDNERITRHICKEIGVPVSGVLTGEEMSKLSAEALVARVASVNLFCRVTPQQKERVLLACKKAGHVAGFLGDGINDASALHAADVGISVDSAADVAKEAADLVLLEHDLGVVHDGVVEGRRTVENVTKYIMMGSSSNLGNMVSMAGAALFLPFLPMLPTQVLLNNLLYDCSEVGVPFDNVDAQALERPVQWDIGLVQRFMMVLGPVSSLFDFLTFYALLKLFGATEAMFQTGWFIESLATQCLVIFVIRTRGRPWETRPHPLLAALSIGAVAAGILVAVTPLGGLFGFVLPPWGFWVFLTAAVIAYLSLVEVVKRIVVPRLARHA